MLIRHILLKAIGIAVRNPTVRRKAGELASVAAEKSRPALLGASRKLGEVTRATNKQIKSQMQNLKNPRKPKN